MNVTLPPLAGAAAQVWPLLFDLAADQPDGWVLAGSQMVIVHAAAHGITRPLVTEDADVLVDIRQLPTAEVASWLQQHGIELQDVSPDGIGHRFHRGQLAIDVLSIDHADNTDRTTVPPARTIQMPEVVVPSAASSPPPSRPLREPPGPSPSPTGWGRSCSRRALRSTSPTSVPSTPRTSPCCSACPSTFLIGWTSSPVETVDTYETPARCSTRPHGTRSPTWSTSVPVKPHSRCSPRTTRAADRPRSRRSRLMAALDASGLLPNCCLPPMGGSGPLWTPVDSKGRGDRRRMRGVDGCGARWTHPPKLLTGRFQVRVLDGAR